MQHHACAGNGLKLALVAALAVFFMGLTYCRRTCCRRRSSDIARGLWHSCSFLAARNCASALATSTILSQKLPVLNVCLGFGSRFWTRRSGGAQEYWGRLCTEVGPEAAIQRCLPEERDSAAERVGEPLCGEVCEALLVAGVHLPPAGELT